MKVVAVIPARHGSTRFPGKPMALISEKPMIQHVYQRVKASNNIDSVIVATDHDDIYQAVVDFGGEAIITRKDHESGSDRMAEVASKVDGDLFLNVQGDEPLIRTELIDQIVKLALDNEESVVTAKVKIKDIEDLNSPNVVKVVADNQANAMYFSRSPIPYNRSIEPIHYFKHLGIYCFPKKTLEQFVTLPKSILEKTEMLEQLRLLDNGINIKVLETNYDAVGVDTPEDILKVERILEAQHG
ncbi:3-deoxy-manno-octulosonate cytidylyltransferase [Guptibacillus sedimenti]|uniref:3-deoxy-manno-octulosonate cytidylyltransferase n=1 Tax=Guptibacillus sedimenti TaxID=3025680 RepID=UPI00235E6ACA|nr:3-deoxy-manno-octulosonate cytidylyltransferase [Pseudalkalibacillus sedimenti]